MHKYIMIMSKNCVYNDKLIYINRINYYIRRLDFRNVVKYLFAHPFTDTRVYCEQMLSINDSSSGIVMFTQILH